MSYSPRRRLTADASKELILAAAEGRFVQLGYERTRLEDVARDMGIGRSGVLYHFSSKRLLYRAVLENMLGDGVIKAAEIIGGEGPLEERLQAFVHTAVTLMVERPGMARIAMREAATRDPQTMAIIHLLLRPLIELLQQMIHEGERCGRLPQGKLDPYFLLSAISGTLSFYFGALPVFYEDLPEDYLSPQRTQILETNLLGALLTMLGLVELPSPDSAIERENYHGQ